jgi:dienelactone hydrolase
MRYTRAEDPYPASRLYLPVGAGPHPAILLLHGSEGGDAPWNRALARFFAARGFVALAFSWCGAKGLPRDIIDIPLERTVAAFAWLKKHPQVAPVVESACMVRPEEQSKRLL